MNLRQLYIAAGLLLISNSILFAFFAPYKVNLWEMIILFLVIFVAYSIIIGFIFGAMFSLFYRGENTFLERLHLSSLKVVIVLNGLSSMLLLTIGAFMLL